MDVQLKDWLNSQKNYLEGVEIYKRLGDDAEILMYFLNSQPHKVSQEKLFESLRSIYYQFKNSSQSIPPLDKMVEGNQVLEETKTFNPTLESICKAEADKSFKELMNIRARLFQHCFIEPDGNENDENPVRLREQYVLEILKLQPTHYEAYEKLHFVREFGRLPEVELSPGETGKNKIPENPLELEKMRVNLMKSISKLKRKEQSPERVDLLQKNQEKLKSIIDVINQL